MPSINLLDIKENYFLGFVSEFAVLEDRENFSNLVKEFILAIEQRFSEVVYKDNLITFESKERHMGRIRNTTTYKGSITIQKKDNSIHFKLHIKYSIFFVLIPTVAGILGFIGKFSLLESTLIFFLATFPFFIWGMIEAGLIKKYFKNTINIVKSETP